MYKLLVNNPVKKFFRSLKANAAMQAILNSIYVHLEDLKVMGWITSFTRKLKEGLWELKVQKARLLYCIKDGCIHLIEGYIKSTPQIPKGILKVATQRYNEIFA